MHRVKIRHGVSGELRIVWGIMRRIRPVTSEHLRLCIMVSPNLRGRDTYNKGGGVLNRNIMLRHCQRSEEGRERGRAVYLNVAPMLCDARESLM